MSTVSLVRLLNIAGTLSICMSLYAPYTTIDRAGIYFLPSNVSYSPVSTNDSIINITSSNVTLDLGNYFLTQGNAVAGLNGIVVAPNLSNVVIRQGTVSTITGTGIGIGSGCSRVILDNVISTGCATLGCSWNGTSASPIRDSFVEHCDFSCCGTGMYLSYVQQSVVADCYAQLNKSAGLVLSTGTRNVIKTCSIRDVTPTSGNAYGILLSGGLNNTVKECTIKNITTSATAATCYAAGISIDTTEDNSHILNCLVTNDSALGAPSNLVNVYGIQTQYTLPALSSSGLPTFIHGAEVKSIDWSPDKRYLAIGGAASENANVRVLEYANNRLTPCATFNHGATVNSVAWSPDGRYVAMGGLANAGTANVQVLEFLGTGFGTPVTFNHGAEVKSVAWSPDGKFIGIGGLTKIGLSNVNVRVLNFTGNTLSSVAQFNHEAQVNAVSWSPDSRYLAIGGNTLAGTPKYQVRILDFTLTYAAPPITLTALTSFNHNDNANVNCVAFSPNGRFIAIGADSVGDSVRLRILSWNGSTLSSVTGFDHGASILSLDWSADSRYLVMTGVSGTGSVQTRIFDFNDEATLTAAGTYDHGAQVNTAKWSPDGLQLALGGQTGNSVQVALVSALSCAQRCIIQGNTVQGIRGSALAFGTSRGKGVSASSGLNLILQNSALNNDTNYTFVNNVFKQFQHNAKNVVPHALSNLSFPPL